MRLHHLSVEAFGPFVARQDIDFDELSGAGVFLVHGPTGAGKTSLLDAVCFALFSDVPGDRQARGLRSELAEPHTPPSVALEFSAAGRRLRVERTGEFKRPKRRGSGEVKVQSTVRLLEHLAGAWVPVSARIDEAADVLHDLLGMGLAQFRRVALLPQGEFAAFLRATPEDRRTLLERLFDVERFTALEAWFAERRRGLSQEAQQEELTLQFHVAALTDALATVPAEALAGLDQSAVFPAVPVEDWAGVIPRVDAAMTLWADRELLAFQQVESVERAAARRRDEAERIAGLRSRGAAAQRGLALLSADAPRIETLRRIAEAGLAAAGLRGELAGATAAEAAEAAADTACRAAYSAACEAGVRASMQGVADAQTTLDAGGELLADTQRHLQAAATARAEIERLTDTRATCHAAMTQLRADLDLAVATRAAVSARLAALAADAAGEALWSARVREVAALRRTHEAAGEACMRVDGVQAAVSAAADEVIAAQQHLIACQQARLGNLAAELALALRDGCPCPVCGSAEHPHPRGTGGGWDADALIAAEEEAERCAARVRQLRTEQVRATDTRAAQMCALADRLAELQLGEWPDPVAGIIRQLTEHVATERRFREGSQQATGDKPGAGLGEDDGAGRPWSTDVLATLRVFDAQAGEWLDQLGDTIGREHARVTQAASDLRTAQAQAEQAEDDLKALQHKLSRASADAAAAGARLADVNARQLDELAHVAYLARRHAVECICAAASAPPIADDVLDLHVAAVHGADPGQETPPESPMRESLAAAEAALREWQEASVTQHLAAESAARAFVAARARAEQATHDRIAAGTALDAALARSDFPDRDALVAALVDTADLRAMQEEVTGYDRMHAVHSATLADDDVRAALAVTDPPDPAAARAALDGARVACQEALRRHTAAQRSAEQVAGIGRDICATAARLAPLAARCAEVSELADLLAGTSANNGLRMRLSAFVLAARLERVVELANERLALMDSGRYRLQYDDARAARGARSGLGLLVHDEWSGTTRQPGSLSGGESFMASLALALGLADAIRETSGGQEVQTLFVDEGFGSLDQESLEHVMTVLDGLRDGGRTVGVVSHVGDLRDRIPLRIEVRKSPHGSSVVLTSAAPAA